MADPATPTVPNAAGVPPVNGSGASSTSPVTPASGDAIVVTGAQTKWGIHNTDGSDYFANSVGPTSYMEVNDTAEGAIPDYPTEDGGFESYNKSQKPGTVTLSLTCAGTLQSRQAFRNAVETLRAGLTLVNILTPGYTYRGYNLVRTAARRAPDKGANVVIIECAFIQVRQTVTIAYSNTSSVTAAATVNGGSVQTQTPAANQTPASAPQ